MDVRERMIGCLTGLAVGDALGTTLEFTKPGTFEPIDDMADTTDAVYGQLAGAFYGAAAIPQGWRERL